MAIAITTVLIKEKVIMLKLVLCVSRDALFKQGIDKKTGLYPLNLSKISKQDFHFINRGVVDSKDTQKHIEVGQTIPQVLPYVIVKNNDLILSYSRVGAETRLHGKRSIGIGGHIDIEDFNLAEENPFMACITKACCREIEEELNIKLDPNFEPMLNTAIIDLRDEVGTVHLGVVGVVNISEIGKSEELHDPKWLTIDELKADIDNYEGWSRLLIDSF